tara:strand:+ start:2722 stop:3144 length:423 start_codon:yes stop_codon:yes gene_type:complete
MAITKVSGNQIATSTEAIIATLSFVNTNSVFRMPAGTQAQRPTGVSVGTIRFNSDTDSAEIYKADDGTGSPGWSPVSGGGPALGTDSIVRTNPNTISENITVGPTTNNDAKFANGMSAGPITIANGFTVTIEAGGAWSVV